VKIIATLAVMMLIVLGILASMIGKRNSCSEAAINSNKKQPIAPSLRPDLVATNLVDSEEEEDGETLVPTQVIADDTEVSTPSPTRAGPKTRTAPLLSPIGFV
jgi:hypothetical protein